MSPEDLELGRLEAARQRILARQRADQRRELLDLVDRQTHLAAEQASVQLTLDGIAIRMERLDRDVKALRAALEQDQTRSNPALERRGDRLPEPGTKNFSHG